MLPAGEGARWLLFLLSRSRAHSRDEKAGGGLILSSHSEAGRRRDQVWRNEFLAWRINSWSRSIPTTLAGGG